MNDTYITINNIAEGYYTEKRSTFYAFAHHVTSADEVKELFQKYKKEYYDARHVCYAYRLGPEGAEFRANDDGEPSSTAGKPILGVLLSEGVTDVVIFVIRYYGGVNLGTGGLIVAYREAAHDAMTGAEKSRIAMRYLTGNITIERISNLKFYNNRTIRRYIREFCECVRKFYLERFDISLAKYC